MPAFLRAFCVLERDVPLAVHVFLGLLRDCSQPLSTSLGVSLISKTGHCDLFLIVATYFTICVTNLEIVDFLVLTDPAIFLEMMFRRSHTIFN
jgi:hypothetical protein